MGNERCNPSTKMNGSVKAQMPHIAPFLCLANTVISSIFEGAPQFERDA